MKPKTIAPYGTWCSEISAEIAAGSNIRFGQIQVYQDKIFWVEQRPQENGRSVLVCMDKFQNIEDQTPKEYNVRSTVHEMGGSAFLIAENKIYFCNNKDQRIYVQSIDSSKAEVISADINSRYVDLRFDKTHNRIICVREDHSDPKYEPLNSLDYLDLNSQRPILPETLLAGSDFFSSPKISPSGKLLAWLTWNHPHMPWDESKLWTANIGKDGSLSNIQLIAGGSGESVVQPEWLDDSTLFFISDKNGWWNIHVSYSGLVEPLLAMDAEFALPHWGFGESNYCLRKTKDLTQIICTYAKDGLWHLAEIDINTAKLTNIENPFQEISSLHLADNLLIFKAGSPDRFSAIISLDLKHKEFKTIRSSNSNNFDSSYFSKAQFISFPSTNNSRAYAFYYPPHNPNFESHSEAPPCIVKSHGGPTDSAKSTLDLNIQFWTSRGFAVVDVNYRGSTGFGKKYRQMLRQNWGIVDVEDCIAATESLISQGLIDKDRLIISGGSAGGYTTLCALTFHNIFKAGASYYGIGDLASLACDTHKFESHYLDSLIGPYPEKKELYDKRSPLKHAKNISAPIIFFQGKEDKVVPPSQSESMVEALKQNGIPVCYISFPDEQHGFRQASSKIRCLESELTFYCMVFNIERNDLRQDLEIINTVHTSLL